MNGPVRLGVIGLGMMGRHHARIAARLPDLTLVGAADPQGDLHHSLAMHPRVDSVDELLAEGIDAAVVAVPTEQHEKVALQLADAGIHTLIEKPLAGDVGSATRIRDAFAGSGLVAAVGHVERCNPALLEMKRRLDGGALGRLFAIKTRRVGPYPLRVQDVGVVKDLATHDIDLVLWLGGKFANVSGEMAHKLGRPHEDLVEVVGRLENDIVATISVNWLTPSKERRVIALGARGALVADLISADLTFYANADVPMEWEEMARLKGVSEGDMIRYALRKKEPLQLELENFRDAILGRSDAPLVSLDEGLDVITVAERILTDGTGSI